MEAELENEILRIALGGERRRAAGYAGDELPYSRVQG